MVRKEVEHIKTLRSLKRGLFVQQRGFAGIRNFSREILGRALAKSSRMAEVASRCPGNSN